MHRDRATTIFARHKSSPDGDTKSLSKSVGHGRLSGSGSISSRQYSFSEGDKNEKRLTLVPDLDGSRPTVHMHQPEHIKKIAVTRLDKPNIFYELNQVCSCCLILNITEKISCIFNP